tara:strand:+ start:16235 stop:16537 length:303 start_codon:yes stop_codon:yes gene_type:complete
MLYAIHGEDNLNSLEKRVKSRPSHLERIKELQNEGRLLLAGPYPAIDSSDPGPAGFTGSLIIAEFVSLKEARIWAEADPYFISGVYSKVIVRPFKKILPE